MIMFVAVTTTQTDLTTNLDLMNSTQTLQKMKDMRLHGMAGIYETGHTVGTYASFSGDELLAVLIDAECVLGY